MRVCTRALSVLCEAENARNDLASCLFSWELVKDVCLERALRRELGNLNAGLKMHVCMLQGREETHLQRLGACRTLEKEGTGSYSKGACRENVSANRGELQMPDEPEKENTTECNIFSSVLTCALNGCLFCKVSFS